MNTYHILSLDGGGIRGLLTVALLERLERARPGFLKQVDLFAGTSTGSFLDLGIANGLSPTEMRKVYDGQGKWIFQDSLLDNVRDLGFMRGARYSNKHLKQALVERFGSHTLGDLNKKVLVASFDLDNRSVNLDKPRMWKAKFFHNFSGDDSDADERIVDVALRSSAAPTYFPVYQGYVDGFVVANNPSMCALAQVIGAEIRTESAELADIALLSVGTGLNQRYLPQEDADWGLRQWAIQFQPRQHRWYTVPLIYMMWEGSVDLANYQCRQLLGDRFHRLDALLPQLVDIDGVGQMELLNDVANQMARNRALQWLDAHFASRESVGEEDHDLLLALDELYMSKEMMQAIIGRVALDEDFRIFFFANPNEALAGYDLTREERAALLSVDAETLDAFAERRGVQLGTGGRLAQSRGSPPKP